jgi:hypothetical protein
MGKPQWYAVSAALVLLGGALMTSGARHSGLLLIAGLVAGVLTRALGRTRPYDPRARPGGSAHQVVHGRVGAGDLGADHSRGDRRLG